jgi:shikimate 5-dehydrogenase
MKWWPRCVQEAKEEGCAVVSGVEMFIGQAVEQFRLFTKMEPPEELMRKVVMDSLLAK